MSRRVNVYIDGFNFYYGMLHQKAPCPDCKWLDLERLFQAVRNEDDVQAVKYFTAFWPDDESGERHRTYVRALGASPRVETVLGRYQKKRMKCQSRKCSLKSNQRSFSDWEEKETDVNIALSMASDAYEEACEGMVLVSGDSDLVPAINLVKRVRPAIKVIVYIPGDRSRLSRANALRGAADKARMLPLEVLKKFLLPNPVTVSGQQVYKPESW